jgi:hypothetical protein
MSNDYDDDLDLDIPDLRKADRAKAKRIKELEAEINDLRKAGRERAVKDVLVAKGVTNPGKIARLIPADVSAEAEVEAWLTEYADVFNIETSNDGGSDDGTPGTPNGMTPADVAAFNQINSAGAGLPIEAQTDLTARMLAADSPEELQRILAGQ